MRIGQRRHQGQLLLVLVFICCIILPSVQGQHDEGPDDSIDFLKAAIERRREEQIVAAEAKVLLVKEEIQVETTGDADGESYVKYYAYTSIIWMKGCILQEACEFPKPVQRVYNLALMIITKYGPILVLMGSMFLSFMMVVVRQCQNCFCSRRSGRKLNANKDEVGVVKRASNNNLKKHRLVSVMPAVCPEPDSWKFVLVTVYMHVREDNGKVVFQRCVHNTNMSLVHGSIEYTVQCLRYGSTAKAAMQMLSLPTLEYRFMPIDGVPILPKNLPVIDIYGILYADYEEYLCNSPPFVPPKSGGGSVEHEAEAMPNMNDYQVIQERTRHFESLLKVHGNLVQQQSKVTSEVDALIVNVPVDCENLMKQVDVQGNTTIKWARKGLKFFSFIYDVFADSPATVSVGGHDFDLDSLSRNTNIVYGATLSYEEFAIRCKPGDMIAVHGTHVMSRVICKMQTKFRDAEPYLSHVGIAVNTSIFYMPGMVEGEWYMLESATGGGVVDASYDILPDVYGLARSGVQVRRLRKLIEASVDQQALYMHCPLNPSMRAIFDDHVGCNRKYQNEPCRMASHLPKVLNKPYTTTAANFLLGVHGVDGGMIRNGILTALTNYALSNQSAIGSEFVCSELVYEMYQACGLMPHPRRVPLGGHVRDYVDSQDLKEQLVVPRQVYPLDFFLTSSKIPYMFDNVHVITAS